VVGEHCQRLPAALQDSSAQAPPKLWQEAWQRAARQGTRGAAPHGPVPCRRQGSMASSCATCHCQQPAYKRIRTCMTTVLQLSTSTCCSALLAHKKQQPQAQGIWLWQCLLGRAPGTADAPCNSCPSIKGRLPAEGDSSSYAEA
jgi:hypothetical protein